MLIHRCVHLVRFSCDESPVPEYYRRLSVTRITRNAYFLRGAWHVNFDNYFRLAASDILARQLNEAEASAGSTTSMVTAI
jgi:hypothetical protein